jgi:hypothetical protein
MDAVRGESQSFRRCAAPRSLQAASGAGKRLAMRTTGDHLRSSMSASWLPSGSLKNAIHNS